MDLVYQKEPKNIYDLLLLRLQREFPDRKFRIKEDFHDGDLCEVGIEEKTGFWFFQWRQLDLVAMNLLKTPLYIPARNLSGGGASVDSLY